MDKESLLKSIEEDESMIHKLSAKLRELVFYESYDELYNECNNIKYEIENSLDDLCTSVNRLKLNQ